MKKLESCEANVMERLRDQPEGNKERKAARGEEKMKRGRQEEIIKQRKDTNGGVGGEREGKMT